MVSKRATCVLQYPRPMEILLFSLFLLLLVALLALVLTQLAGLSPKDQLPYYKSPFISPAELSFFTMLEQAIGEKYRIFPQVNVASLVKVSAQGKDWWRYSGKINRKSVDFVLADKTTCRPILVIELDDFSHQGRERKQRDVFLNRVFDTIGLPILHVIPKSGYSVAEIRDAIRSSLPPPR